MVFLRSLEAKDHAAQMMLFANLIYADRLGGVVVDRQDPRGAVLDVATRFSDILNDHLILEITLLGMASQAAGRDPQDMLTDLLDEVQ